MLYNIGKVYFVTLDLFKIFENDNKYILRIIREKDIFSSITKIRGFYYDNNLLNLIRFIINVLSIHIEKKNFIFIIDYRLYKSNIIYK